MKQSFGSILAAGLFSVVALLGCKEQVAVQSSSNLAPEGVYYLKVAAQGRLAGKPVTKNAGTLLHKVRENTFQSLDGAEMTVAPEFVTNDMRVVRLIEQEARRTAVPPSAPVAQATPAPKFENPLSKGAYDNRGWRRYATPVPNYR